MAHILTGMDCLRAERGLLTEISKRLGITRAAVAKWRRIPAERVLAVEEITGIDRSYLRPDIYPMWLADGERRLANSLTRTKRNSVSASL